MRHDDRGDRPRDDTPVDLRALLGDHRSADRWAALAARIDAAAAPELALRSAFARRTGAGLADGVAAAVARFAAPALIAAAAAIVIAIGAARQSSPDAAPADLVASAESLSEETVRQALGAEPNAWLGTSVSSDADDLVRAMYDGGGQE